jgi:hypothetical protein
MTDTIIHHINISYDETDERVRKFIDYLKSEKRKQEMEGYYGSARASNPAEKYVLAFGHEFSFVCDGSHRCVLKLRGT